MVYKKEYLEAFLKNQSQLFDEPVAETLEEADAFLDEASRKRSCSKNLRCLRFRMDNT